QGVRERQGPGVARPAAGRGRDPAAADRDAAPVRPPGVPAAERRRAVRRAAQGVPPGRDAVREARGQLRGHGHARDHRPVPAPTLMRQNLTPREPPTTIIKITSPTPTPETKPKAPPRIDPLPPQA